MRVYCSKYFNVTHMPTLQVNWYTMSYYIDTILIFSLFALIGVHMKCFNKLFAKPVWVPPIFIRSFEISVDKYWLTNLIQRIKMIKTTNKIKSLMKWVAWLSAPVSSNILQDHKFMRPYKLFWDVYILQSAPKNINTIHLELDIAKVVGMLT